MARDRPVSRLDDWAARISGVWEPSMAPPEPVDEPAHASPLLKTSYEETAEVVVAEELDVSARLAHLVDGRGLSPLEAARALFGPIGEEATDVA